MYLSHSWTLTNAFGLLLSEATWKTSGTLPNVAYLLTDTSYTIQQPLLVNTLSWKDVLQIDLELVSVSYLQYCTGYWYGPFCVIGHGCLNNIHITQKDKYAVKWCYFILRNNILIWFEIKKKDSYAYVHLKNIDISTHHMLKGVKLTRFVCAETKLLIWKLNVVAYYKVTSLCRKAFCLSCII